MKKKIYAIVIVLLIVILIVLSVLVLNFFPNKTEANYYIGITQLLSGFFTVVGVSITIIYTEISTSKSEEKTEGRFRERLRLENLPLMQYEIDKKNTTNGGASFFIDCDHTDKDVSHYPLNITLKNVGLRPAQHINFHFVTDKKMQNGTGLPRAMLKPEEDATITFYFITKTVSTDGITRENYNDPKFQFYHEIKVLVYFDDLIGNRYMQEISGGISRSFGFVDGEETVSITDTAWALPYGAYKQIHNDFTYQIPQETLDLFERSKRNQQRIQEYEKLANKKDIDSLVNVFMNKQKRQFDDYPKRAYKKVNFASGGRYPIDFKVVSDTIFDITIEGVGTVDENRQVIFDWVLRVDLAKKTVKRAGKKIVLNTLRVSRVRKLIGKFML